MTDIPGWKKEEVKRLRRLLKTSPVVGIVDIEGIPSLQMQEMRSQLRGNVNITVSRNTLIEKALDEISESREDIEELKDHLKGQTAIVTTGLNPFKLFNRMEETKTKAPAKGGETATEDIEVEKGSTPFKPGPIVGDLQKVGIPASIQGGNVVINESKTIVEEGEEISPDVANMLSRLEIYPITVGLDLRVAYEEGMLFEKSSLDIDQEEFIDDIKRGAFSAFNLSVNSAFPTRTNMQPMIKKAYQDAFSLAVNSDILTGETLRLKIDDAYNGMLSLASKLSSDALTTDMMESLGMEDEETKQEEQEREQEEGDQDEKEDEEKVENDE